MVFCYIMSGVMISFVYGQFSILFYKYYQNSTKEELNKLTFTAFIIEGAGEFCGGLIIALFSKRIKNLGLLFGLNSLAFLGSVGLVSLGFTEDNKQVIYGGAFVLGVTDCLCFSQALAFAGKWDERGLSMFNLGQSGTVAVLSILHIFVELQFLFMIYAAALVLTWLSVWGNRKELNERSGDVITNK